MTDFSQLLDKAGIPKDLETAKTQLKAELKRQNSELSNADENSAGLTLFSAILSNPTLQIRKTLEKEVLPGLFIKTAKGSWLDKLADQRKIARIQPSKAKGTITFYRVGTSGDLLIPKGTQVASQLINSKQYKLLTLANATITDGNSHVDIVCEALEPGSAYNLATGYYSVLFSAVSGVSRVSNLSNWLTKAGTDRESDEELRKRTRNKIADSANWHLTESYKSIIMSQTGVPYDLIFFDLTEPRGQGSADAYAILETGQLSNSLITKCNQYINDKGHHGLGDDMQFKAIPTLNIDLIVEFQATSNQDAVKTKIQNITRCAFRENADFELSQKITPMQTFYYQKLATDLQSQIDDLKFANFYEMKNGTKTRLDQTIAGLKMPTLTSFTINHI